MPSWQAPSELPGQGYYGQTPHEPSSFGPPGQTQYGQARLPQIPSGSLLFGQPGQVPHEQTPPTPSTPDQLPHEQALPEVAEDNQYYVKRPSRSGPTGSKRRSSKFRRHEKIPSGISDTRETRTRRALRPEIVYSSENDEFSEHHSQQPGERKVDISHEPSKAAKDVTVRLDLPIEEDYEADLEEFCRLRRLGRFRDAKACFHSKLEHLHPIPYILVQRAEMLIAAGDYKCFQKLDSEVFFRDELEASPDDQNLQLLARNFALLELLSQRPSAGYTSTALRVVQETLVLLHTEEAIGSAEVQLISPCFRILRYIEICSGELVVNDLKEQARTLLNWSEIYHQLLCEDRIWDFRDLFVAAVPLFRWPDTLFQFFGTRSFPLVLKTISKDWSGPGYDESTTLGLLDLFTSLIIQDPHTKNSDTRTPQLIQYARSLAETVHTNNVERMKSRPFIQWILAKNIYEMGEVLERSDSVGLGDYKGLLVHQGNGVHLPVFVPLRRSQKPDWDMFFARSNQAQLHAAEVALQAARFTGDYNLQATALKLLALQSRAPIKVMDALANLQLNIQDDKEGYLGTCLSKYLGSNSEDNEAEVLGYLKKLDDACGGSYMNYGINASMLWARGVI
ncbi:hypothetical protein B0T22DRAFT_371280 [Podospora appendiculata]|uniref:Uncharacterized protein n=1 Tax=Podospora appendiculata TaxID=314037 RepID=A0AAE0XK48_9PEZI|nr:hypothetical protein B0T22DRAFT_371280 [Podospora appendiculata]